MRELGYAQLPNWVLSEMYAGQVSTAGIGFLRSGQLSQRKLNLRALLDAIPARRAELGHFGDIEHAWSVLADAERKDVRAVKDVLMAPAVGVWLARALRQALDVPTDTTPVTVELGWLHAVAAAAAVRSEVACTLPIPVVHSAAFLPTVGRFALPAGIAVDYVELRVAPPNITVNVPGGSAPLPLEPVWRHHTTSRGMTLETVIDSADPYRRFAAPEPADVLSDDERARWAEVLDAAWELLTRWHPGYAEELAAGLATIVPLPAVDDVFAASSSAAFGSIAMSPKRSAAEFADALVHELQHSKLNALLDLVELSRPGNRSLLYAPWRDDPRPISGLLHGLYAFVSVVEFWHVQRGQMPGHDIRRAEFAFHLRSKQLSRVIDTVRAHPALTGMGQEFVAGVGRRLVARSSADVSPEVKATVEHLTTDHYAIWRMRHVRPSSREADRLVGDWLASRPARIEPRNDDVRQAGPTGPSPRAALLKARLLEPQRFEQHIEEGPDGAYANGDHKLAAGGYLERIHADRDDIAAWVGFGLAADSPTLLRRPELVHAVYRRLSAKVTPEALVSWFDQSSVSSC